MSATYTGFCENCDEESTVISASSDVSPNTCPFCGGSVDYVEESED